MTLSSRRTKTFESKRQRLKACCPWPAALKPDVAGIVGRPDTGAPPRGPQRQPRARKVAGERRREDSGQPRRALRGEEIRDPLLLPSLRPRPARAPPGGHP